MNVLGRPAGYSWVQPHAVAVEDRREVNPGMLGEGEGEGEEVRLNVRGKSSEEGGGALNGDGKMINGGDGGSWDEHGIDVDLERGRV